MSSFILSLTCHPILCLVWSCPEGATLSSLLDEKLKPKRRKLIIKKDYKITNRGGRDKKETSFLVTAQPK